MASSPNAPSATLLLLLMVTIHPCFGTWKLASLYQPPTTVFKYHNGALLEGDIPISIVWYGKFSPTEKSIIHDFLFSLTPHRTARTSIANPSVSQWWQSVEHFLQKAGKKETQVLLANQITDAECSIGKTLSRPDVATLAARAGTKNGGVTVVLTADDIVVDGFCMSNCGFHSSRREPNMAYIWVGNSAVQCPGQCAWPFHQPIYGPQAPPLVAPNNDVGLDGMIVNLAILFAGTVTNPYGNGFFQGPKEAPVEVAAACSGVYGKGVYPGYAGDLLVDGTTGASYNAHGLNGRKFLLPAMFDPSKASCSTLI